MQAKEESKSAGLILIAYDGSKYAKAAIKEAGEQLDQARPVRVLTVWQSFGAAFVGTGSAPAGLEDGVKIEARLVAEEGARLAREAGFDAETAVERGDPVWLRIVDAAEECDARIVVLGSHGRSGIHSVLIGSVAGAVASHTKRAVLIVHDGEATR
jgi:nucleotide-binding universal stress UspA family protein